MLGRSGDICSILPCLQAEYKETGNRPVLVVSKDYAELTKPLPWLVTEVFDGGFDYLGNALRWAKSGGKVDFIPQQGGSGYPSPARIHPSFQFTQWDRMGRLSEWEKLTLELPRTGNLKIPSKPFILMADHSLSSPFPHKDRLFDRLKSEFRSHSIVRCSSIKAPHLFDFLTLMDAADLIISIDTAFAHLSRACSTPFIMLATDVPSIWHGAAFHPRMSLHVRYADYEMREDELIYTAKKCLEIKR